MSIPNQTLMDARPRRNPDVILQSADEQTLLYDAAADVIHILNPTARLVWDLCDGQHTVGDIVAQLQTTFAVTEAHDVAQDVRAVLEQLAHEGMLTL